MSLTNQPAVPIHVLFKFCWDGALTEYVAVVAGPWVFGTDVPFEALGIGYHLYVDGMPLLTIAVYVLCVTGGAVVPHGCNQWPPRCVGILQF